MAEVVTQFPAPAYVRGGKYQKWLDGQIWKFTDADAIACGCRDLRLLRNAIFSSVNKKGIHITTRIVDGCLYVQATEAPK